ncbi:glycosyltransferase [Candidatus Fukatsuia anoeciicola]|uniref:glycosyltransferase n=1 Tax=Candidatus Fukatsuia anoeciicola TaxID=2994492 RepID=UPI003463C236
MLSFSVLISLYKNEKPQYLNDCLSSIANQTLTPNEIILVLDGSVGIELIEVIFKWLKIIPIKIIKLSKNVGLGQALNIGLQQCKFELVARMDTDDICYSTRFEKQINYIIKYPNIAVLGSNIYEFNNNICNIRGIRTTPSSYEDIVKFSKIRNPFNHMTVIFKKSIIQKVGGYQHHLYMEDYNLWLRVISNKYYVKNLPNILVYARVDDKMIYRRRGLIYIKSEFKIAILKMKLKIQNPFLSLITFCLRSLLRLLSVRYISLIYKKIRRYNNNLKS